MSLVISRTFGCTAVAHQIPSITLAKSVLLESRRTTNQFFCAIILCNASRHHEIYHQQFSNIKDSNDDCELNKCWFYVSFLCWILMWWSFIQPSWCERYFIKIKLTGLKIKLKLILLQDLHPLSSVMQRMGSVAPVQLENGSARL